MNVVFVVSDTFRRDNLSCYGPSQVKTPDLDKLANKSYVFDNAYLGSFPTLPNRLDIMSGRFSCVDHQWCALPKDTITLQQILSASGVVTQMIADNAHLVEDGYNYERGFDGWEWIRGQESDHWKVTPRDIELPAHPDKLNRANFTVKNYLRNTSWWKSEEDRFVARTVTEACNWLENEGQDLEKFFLYVDIFDPHEPWDAPEEYLKMYESEYSGENVFYPYSDRWQEFISEEELNHIRALYKAEVSMVDHWIGVLREKIEKLGLEEDTVFVFTSDHGFLFGEHGFLGKTYNPHPDKGHYEAFRMLSEIRRIPLMIHMPGQKTSQHIEALVQPPDLMPTILELCGLVVTESFSGKSNIQALQCGVFYTNDWKFNPEEIHGKSLMPLLRGEVKSVRDIAVCSNTLIHHTPVVAKCSIITEDGWCLHYAGHYTEELKDSVILNRRLIAPKAKKIPIEPALFYLPDDPNEEHDLIQSNMELAKEIHRRYVKWLEEIGTPEEHLAGRREFIIKEETRN